LTLSEALKVKGEVTVTIFESYVHQQHPHPPVINQHETQLVRYSDNHYIISPYTVLDQITKLTLWSANGAALLESSTEEGEYQLSGDILTYGPYEKAVEPYRNSPLLVHFENNSPFITASKVVREITISHWGNIAVEETYFLEHVGAKLAGGLFSRYEYQRMGPSPSSVRTLRAILPTFAKDIYYRDDIGNVSTSHVNIHADEGIVADFDPRFPLYGGYKIDFYFGYNVNAEELLSYDTSSGNFVLRTDFGVPFPTLVVNELIVKVVLPEGAIDGDLSVDGGGVARNPNEVLISYLDTTGRTVVSATRHNNVVHHNADKLTVAYQYSKISLLRKPVLLVLGILAAFVAAMLWTRLNLDIRGDCSVAVPEAARDKRRL